MAKTLKGSFRAVVKEMTGRTSGGRKDKNIYIPWPLLEEVVQQGCHQVQSSLAYLLYCHSID